MIRRDPLGTWETLPFPSSKAAGDTAHQLQIDPRLRVRGRGGDEQRAHRWYRQAKETKCGEMGGRESQHLIVALKRGNEPSWTPWSEGGAASWRGGLEPCRGHRASKACHRQTAWPCEGQRSHDVTNRVREIRTPGSVGALGGNPQSDPAQFPLY